MRLLGRERLRQSGCSIWDEEYMEANFFRDQRLADIYDFLGSSERSDLDPYFAIVDELDAQTIIDLGSGTGTFACRLAERGKSVIAIEPAEASVNVARRKPGADLVRWVVGDAAAMPEGVADLVTMTGNVPEHLSDEQWTVALEASQRALRAGGHIAVGNRDIEKNQTWLTSPEFAPRSDAGSKNLGERADSTPEGPVHHWLEVLDVREDAFTFRWTYLFESDGSEMTWHTAFRIRTVDQIAAALDAAGFRVLDIRDASGGHDGNEIFIAARR